MKIDWNYVAAMSFIAAGTLIALVVVALGGCEFLQRIVDVAGGSEVVIKEGFKLAEFVVPWPFDILLPGVASLFTALAMKKEDPSP